MLFIYYQLVIQSLDLLGTWSNGGLCGKQQDILFIFGKSNLESTAQTYCSCSWDSLCSNLKQGVEDWEACVHIADQYNTAVTEKHGKTSTLSSCNVVWVTSVKNFFCLVLFKVFWCLLPPLHHPVAMWQRCISLSLCYQCVTCCSVSTPQIW